MTNCTARALAAAMLLAVASAVPARLVAQEPQEPQQRQEQQELPEQPERLGPLPNVLLDGLDWRLVGPFRGGRVAAVTGVPQQRDVYFFGSTGGGVWKTTDGGASWANVSDGTFGGSIGAVAVAPSDPDVIYVGGGEKTWRGNVSSGDGVWKSTDGGATWTFVGLPESRHVSRIRIDPKHPERVFAAVMGHVSGPSQERGVYRSTDGGASWQRVLFANDLAGAVDLCMDPKDANVLYASTWRAVRRPWTFESGGDGSALWKSADGGDTWTELTKNEGMPKGTLGIIGVAVSPADRKRVYAMVEAEDGGLFRSDDAGATWTRVNDDRNLRQRAWYYSRCYADPKDADVVYVLNVGFHRSSDGGKTFERIRTPHGDNHDLWIDPADPRRMIEGNDGGANVSTDGGRTWTAQDNQPTAQFYRVATDTAVPYRIYGAQQDNSTVRIRHQSLGRAIGRDDWESTAGGESGWLAPKPDDPEIVFGGSYGGYLQRLDHRLRLSRNVNVWPDNPMGAGAEAMRYRFQWSFPILFSRHDPDLLFTAGNLLFQTRDQGQSWQAISPDLTRNDPGKLGPSGGPITKDNTGVEYYCTIFSVAESPLRAGTIWCGSDDGRVHVTTDGGGSWKDVTPPELPEWSRVNALEADPFEPGGCYLAATRYELDDFKPYVFVTKDHGATWRLATRGLDPTWFARVVRADPVQPGLLYCGTERTVWVSFDDGWRWQRLQRNLPLVPITDLCVRDDALIAATQGRAFWSFDHLHALRQRRAADAQQDLVLWEPAPFVQLPGGDEEVKGQGRNPANAPIVRFFVGGDAAVPVDEPCRLEVLDEQGAVVFARASAAATAAAGSGAGDAAGDGEAAGDASRTAAANPEAGESDPDAPARRDGDGDGDTKAKDEPPLRVTRGVNAVRIEPELADAKGFAGMVLWSGGLSGPRSLPPGSYRVRLTVGERTAEATLRLQKDPRTPASERDLQAKYAFVVQCRDAITRAHEAILALRSLREQMKTVTRNAGGDDARRLRELATTVAGQLTEVEEALYQTKSKSSQDPLNYPIRLTDKLAGVMSAVNGAAFGPTAAQIAVKDELLAAIDEQLQRYEQVRQQGVAEFNALALQLAVPHVK